jgi:hypothetical protein
MSSSKPAQSSRTTPGSFNFSADIPVTFEAAAVAAFVTAVRDSESALPLGNKFISRKTRAESPRWADSVDTLTLGKVEGREVDGMIVSYLAHSGGVVDMGAARAHSCDLWSDDGFIRFIAAAGCGGI